MKKVWSAVMNVLLWKHERGSWQYDVMCALIVAFIVFTPSSFFRGEFRWQADRSERQAEVLKLAEPPSTVFPADGVKKR